MRLRLDVAYDGGAFSGWGRQPALRTVQAELEDALATLVRAPDPSVRLVVAGRTDAGVHATGQVAHCDLTAEQWSSLAASRRAGTVEQSITRRLNGIVGQRGGDVVVSRVTRAPQGFDARFSAVWRRYEYRIADAVAGHDPRHRGYTLWHAAELDHEAMDAASRSLTGLHDFAAFCRPREGATTIRTLLDYEWNRDPHGVLVATVRADAFCHSMVRALVGAAIAVGRGRLDTAALHTVLAGARRENLFSVVAARGLTLVEVGYPPDDELDARAQLTRARREPLGRSSDPSD
ncbi:MAG: tRNA pseudouridine synthase A [Microcella sp.]|uniref:tRNA pseudouridine synthase A n=1 Tax=Microcella sp. TaxID=1913979 RepID=UPI0024C8315B|nr:tRNA pseudouridine synthase A [Microcella sp.]UYN85080.1 MAG: tRNA pseudouridine synthase A [Microcella sp.]